MGLFSRKKKSDDRSERAEVAPESSVAPESADTTAAEEPERSPSAESPKGEAAAPNVSISFSSFQGVGFRPGPAVESPTPSTAPEPAPAAAPQPKAGDAARAFAERRLPMAPAAPPLNVESVPGVRDNALVRDALERLPEKASGAEAMGVLRQMLQGHLFLRVKGDARTQLAEGKPLSFGIATVNEGKFMLAYSCGRALQDAVRADGDNETSAIAQPVQSLLRQILSDDYAGLIIDNSSAPRRVVLPRAVLEQAQQQGDETLRLKTLIAAPREADTPHKVAALLAQSPPLWIAVGKASGTTDDKLGIAEARLADGTRLVQVHSHPLEIAAMGREEKALPVQAAKLGKLLRDNPQMGGVIIDPAGPLITLTRDELAPVIAIAE